MVRIYKYSKPWSLENRPTLAELMMEFQHSECHDWHDRVYRLLGLVEGGENFIVDYSESFHAFSKRVIEAFATTNDALWRFGGEVGESSEETRIALGRTRPTHRAYGILQYPGDKEINFF